MDEPVRLRRAASISILAIVLLVVGAVAVANGERTRTGNLIVTLDGKLAPLRLPRERPAPVTLHIEGGLQSADGGLLPQVTEVEVGMPSRGEISTVGLPLCPQQKLRHATAAAALSACGDAKVGEGELEAEVVVPNQAPFTIKAQVFAFNGRDGGRRAVILDAVSSRPPLSIVVPFAIKHQGGRFGTVLVGDLRSAGLGAPPHSARIAMDLGRNYAYRGRPRSYLSASCPLPNKFTAGFFSLAEIRFVLAGGSSVSTEITRGCRASPVEKPKKGAG